MSYSAGTAWLQVVPSFRHMDRQMASEVDRLGQIIDRGLRDSLARSVRGGVGDGLDHVDRDVHRSGDRSGDRFGDAFSTALNRRLRSAMRALPEPEIGVARNAFDQEMKDIRGELGHIRDQHINLEIDDDEALRRIALVRQRMLELERSTDDRRRVVDLRASGADLDAFHALVEEARRSGHEAGGNFGGAFGNEVRQRFARIAATLPDIPVRADESPFDRVLRAIRARMIQLRDFRIGIDGDADAFFRRVAAVEGAMQRLRARNVSIPVNFDLDRAMLELRNFTQRVAPDLGRDGGDRTGGRFATAVHTRIAAAIRALPDIRIDADTGPVDRAIAEIRTELTSVRDLHIRGDLDAGALMARLTALQARLRALSAQDVDIQVRADVAGAMTELAAVAAMSRVVQRELSGITPVAQSAVGRLGAIIAAALSMGTVLVPAAAAAAFAIGGIATAAIAAGAGLGVTVLAFSGVVKGLQALGKYQQDVNKSSKSFLQSQTQIASAIDSVGNAERGLANTRVTVALSNARAAKAVVDAQRGVTDANKAARQAQLDLIDAIKSAQRLDEDRALQLKGNALSQRQANLDIAEARRALDKVLSNKSATEEEREQARITFEQRMLELQQLKVEGGRLAEEQSEAAKKGVAGSKQVVAAQERVNDSVQAIRDAEARVAEARAAQAEQARQGAEQIVAAQQAVIAAQRQAQTAYVNAGVAGGEALDNLNDAFKLLSPEAQRFTKYVFSMRDAALALRGAAEKGMLPGVQQALRDIQPYLAGLTSFVFKVAEGLGNIAVEAVGAFRNPVWRQFFQFIDDTAVPALSGMFRFTETVSRGLASLIIALSAFNPQLGRGLLSWAEGFATWARTLSTSTGFQRFLKYVQDNGPAVVHLLGDMGTFIARFVIAAAPIGAIVVRVFEGLFRVINAIPLPVLSALIGLIALWSIALLANAAATRVLTQQHGLSAAATALWSRVVSSTTPVTVAYTTAVSAAAVGTGRLTSAMAIGSGVAAAAKTVFQGLWSFLGGPFGLAIVAATIGLSLLFSHTRSQTQANEGLRASLLGLAEAYAKAGDASAENVQSMVRQNKELRNLILNARGVSVDVADIASAINGEAEARDRVLGTYDAQISRMQLLADEYDSANALGAEEAALLEILNEAGVKNRDELGDMIKARKEERASIAGAIDQRIKEKQAADLLAEAQRGLRATVLAFRDAVTAANPSADMFGKAIDLVGGLSADTASKAKALAEITEKVGQSNLSAGDKADLFNKALKGIGSTAQSSGPTFDALAGVFNSIGDSALTARDKSDLLTQAIDQMYGAAIKQTEATETLARTQLDLSARLADNGFGFDLTAKKAKGHTQEVISNRDALEAALQALRAKYVQDIANGLSEDQAREAHRKSTEALLNQIPVTERNSKAVQDLVRDYGSIPPVKKTDVSTPGLNEAIFALIEAHAINEGLAAKPPWDKGKINAEIATLKAAIFGGYAGDPRAFKAEGGPIEGYSPHRSADNIAIWATADEYMHPVDTVRYYGVSGMDAIRQRRVPREVIQGYAAGGLISRFGAGLDTSKLSVNLPVQFTVPNVADWWKKYDDEVQAYYASVGAGSTDFGAGPGFPPWPAHTPGNGGGYFDSGVWRSIVALIKSTGPVSGSFGNAYRPGDPLWHGMGRAVDWMGYNQDALASWLAGHRPLELIHRTGKRDYAYTRGVDKGSFNNALMEAHRNHVHIAMDDGGYLQPGWNPPIWNGTGQVEPVLNPTQWHTMQRMSDLQAQNAGVIPRQYHFQFASTTLTPGKLRALQDRDDALARRGRAR